MAKQLLSLHEIAELNSLLRDLFDHHIKLRAANPLAQKIQFPKIPPILSESMAFHLVKSQIILRDMQISGVSFSTSGGDLEVILNDGIQRNVEVKATARGGFQHFSSKDIAADILIWIHFGDCFVNPYQDQIQIHTLKNPQSFFPAVGRINLSKFCKIGGTEIEIVNIQLPLPL